MLFVHPHVEPLPITDAGCRVRNFINGHGLAPRSASGQQRHQEKKQCCYKKACGILPSVQLFSPAPRRPINLMAI
jgi:hypothetical protein